MIVFVAALAAAGLRIAPPQAIRLDQLQPKAYTVAKSFEVTGANQVIDGHGATLIGSPSITCIHIAGGAHLTLKNLKIQGFATGILAQDSAQLSLSSVTVSGCQTGVRMEKCPEGFTQGLTIHGCQEGLHITGTVKEVVERCDLSANKKIGFSLEKSTLCIVRDNRINSISEGVGFQMTSCSKNQILRNTIVRCGTYGIYAPEAGVDSGADNTFDGNDVSWTTKGTGMSVVDQGGLKILDCTAGYCRDGIVCTLGTDTLLKGNLLVGNTGVGVTVNGGTGVSLDTNVFVKEDGSPTALKIVGPITSAAGVQAVHNIFEDYLTPIRVENATPVTFQSNAFPGNGSIEDKDLISAVGRRPLVLDSSDDKPKGLEFVPSTGAVAPLPSVYDRISGVSVSASNPGDYELIVEGSLTGSFQGEEEVIATYKGELPVDFVFPPKFEGQVRVRMAGEKPVFVPFVALLGENSLSRDMPADDSSDTLFTPGFAVDANMGTRDHYWKATKGKVGEWWEVDLKRTETINAVSILARLDKPDAFWQKFHVAVSTTGLFQGEEVTVATETDFASRPGPRRVYKFSPVPGRYLRVYADVDQADVGLQFFGVYGIRH